MTTQKSSQMTAAPVKWFSDALTSTLNLCCGLARLPTCPFHPEIDIRHCAPLPFRCDLRKRLEMIHSKSRCTRLIDRDRGVSRSFSYEFGQLLLLPLRRRQHTRYVAVLMRLRRGHGQNECCYTLPEPQKTSCASRPLLLMSTCKSEPTAEVAGWTRGCNNISANCCVP